MAGMELSVPDAIRRAVELKQSAVSAGGHISQSDAADAVEVAFILFKELANCGSRILIQDAEIRRLTRETTVRGLGAIRG